MAFIFNNPGKVRVRDRLIEDQIIDTSTEVWSWRDGGIQTKIDWKKYQLNNELEEILKAYIFHRLQTRSLYTIKSNDLTLIKAFITNRLAIVYPWSLEHIQRFMLDILKINPDVLVPTFRAFYTWCLKKNIQGVNKDVLEFIYEIKFENRKPYANAFLNPTYLTSEDEALIINYLNKDDHKNYNKFRDKVLLQIAFELGPRPIQIYSLNTSDLISISSPNMDSSFYSLSLQMAKKISNTNMEKRTRSISSSLGEKLSKLISWGSKEFSENDSLALFLKNCGRTNKAERLTTIDIRKIIVQELGKLGFKKGDGATLLRHHLAQSLADQGAPAEVIAEILGHNSTLPARAYIAATPEISKIKTKALGKSNSYKNIMGMLLTGEIIDKASVPKERWVKGLLGSQYIGGIGSCGLPENTACPKNPVYACYTCHKYHPFSDGNHDAVKQGLQKQAQFFIDHAEAGNDLKTNRAVIQLEKTIEAVDAVIERCKSHKK
ncbi:site-specific integrase [Sporocytophaga myxococcoides]|uniref:site-specific integrase n=1 Tax=Sporocytophaga myxococcoides TaxID=153721 RepID=UPI00146D2137|nr:site-specific integrase [Sporocytophaga myxococcoides]